MTAKQRVKCPLCSMSSSCTCSKDQLRERIWKLEEFIRGWQETCERLEKREVVNDRDR